MSLTRILVFLHKNNFRTIVFYPKQLLIIFRLIRISSVQTIITLSNNYLCGRNHFFIIFFSFIRIIKTYHTIFIVRTILSDRSSKKHSSCFKCCCRKAIHSIFFTCDPFFRQILNSIIQIFQDKVVRFFFRIPRYQQSLQIIGIINLRSLYNRYPAISLHHTKIIPGTDSVCFCQKFCLFFLCE